MIAFLFCLQRNTFSLAAIFMDVKENWKERLMMWQYKMFFSRYLKIQTTWGPSFPYWYMYIGVLCKNICAEVFSFCYFSLASDWPFFSCSPSVNVYEPCEMSKIILELNMADHKNIWRFHDRKVTLIDEYTEFETKRMSSKLMNSLSNFLQYLRFQVHCQE